MLSHHKKNKKAVSIMIGYVLLITGVIIIGGLVYAWLSSYVPRPMPECPDGVSLFIEEVNCNQDGNNYEINLSIKNNGRFDVDGYYIKASEEEGEIATIDISENIYSGGNAQAGIILFSEVLEPGENAPLAKYNELSKLYLIEIIPIRYETIEGKNTLMICGDAKIREKDIC